MYCSHKINGWLHTGEQVFIKVDKQTKKEVVISSTEMTNILERDVSNNLVDDTLTDMVLGAYQHRDREAIYKYKA